MSKNDNPPRLRDGLRFERIADEVIVLDEAAHRVHRLRGPAARLVVELQGGSEVAFGDEATSRVVGALRAAGVVEGGVTRRRALGAAAAAAAGLGILTLSLPGAAAAESGGGDDGGDSDPGSSLTVTGGTDGAPTGATALGTHTYHSFTSDGSLSVTGTGSIDVDVLLIGGGGGGGSYGDSLFGASGGAGGAVSFATGVTLTPDDSPFAVVVGSGGSGGTGTGNGVAGGRSSFDLGGPLEVTAVGGGEGLGAVGSTGGSVGAGTAGSSARSGGAGGQGGERASGGGAGAGGDGGPNVLKNGGAGGDGYDITSFFDGTISVAGGGGGGGYYSSGLGGVAVDGGGAGAAFGGSGIGADADDFGGGGGGGIGADFGGRGGAGFDGLVVVRYLTADL